MSYISNSVAFSYDFGALKADNFSFIHTSDSDQIVPLNTTTKTVSASYYLPGHFTAKLLKGNTAVKSLPIYLPTNGWQAMLNNSSLKFPIYLDETQLLQDSLLHFRSSDYQKMGEGQDYVNIWLHNFTQEPRIQGDDFELSCSLKLDSAFQESPCKVTSIFVHGSKESIRFGFCIPGCVGDLNFYFAGESIRGQTTDFSGFGRELKDWLDIKLIVRNQELSISSENQVLIKHPLKKKLGLISGVSLIFDGMGKVRKVELRDGQNLWKVF